LRNKGAEILLVLNGSPYEADKTHLRLQLARKRALETGLPLIYVNQLGGQDELVFDGSSFVIGADGKLTYKLKAWLPASDITLWDKQGSDWICAPSRSDGFNGKLENYYHAMVIGLRDYCAKNYFKSIVIGMSGGIDSALSAAVAVDAIGAENVALVMMPSRYTSEESLLDAADCAELLGARIDNMSIVPAVKAFGEMLLPAFAGMKADLTEENLQSRIRGVLLMALSNKHGHLLLTTGNKSEMSVGYATLYGDMCGGFSVLKDIYKMELFELCRWRNDNHPYGGLGPRGHVITQNIIDKPPSAELRPDQRDDDSLPPYEILDDILECLIEKEMRFADIVAKGHDAETVAKIEHLLYIAEYKRRQAPPGVKLTSKNFGRDRRYPITNGFRDSRT
jgi:NAD+ synthase